MFSKVSCIRVLDRLIWLVCRYKGEYFQVGKGNNTFPHHSFVDSPNPEWKLNPTHLMGFVLERVENIVGKGEDASQPAFTTFPPMFKIKKKQTLPSVVKLWLVL